MALLLAGTTQARAQTLVFAHSHTAPEHDAQSATIAVSEDGKVALAVATSSSLDLVLRADDGRPLVKSTQVGKFVARGEDRPQIGFHGEEPWIVGLDGSGDVLLMEPLKGGVFARVEHDPDHQRDRIECVVAGFHPDPLEHHDAVTIAWMAGGRCFFSSARFPDSPSVGGHLSGELAAGRPCPCCHPAVATSATGRSYLAFRDERKGVRDIYLARLPGGGHPGLLAEPVPVSTEGWRSKSCPMAGPAVAAPDDGTVVVAYVLPAREGGAGGGADRPSIRVARSTDAGASFGPAREIGPGKKPSLSVSADGRVVALAYEADEHAIAAISRDGGASFGGPFIASDHVPGATADGASIAVAADGRSVWVSWIQHQGDRRDAVLRRVVLED